LEQIRATFFQVESGAPGDPAAVVALDRERLEAYGERVDRKLRFVRQHVEREERIDRGRGRKKARKRAETRDSVLALRAVQDRLERLAAESDPVRQQEIAAELLTIEYATRSYTEPIGSISIPVHLWNIVFDWSMPDRSRARHAKQEAANLVDRDTGAFLGTDDIAVRIGRGEDLSLFDPPPETVFWRAIPDVGGVDIEGHYFGGGIPVQAGEVSVFPPEDGARVDFRKVHLTQSKPKLDVTWRSPDCLAKKKSAQRDCTRSYKLKFGMETHADPTANALLAAMGYNADIALHLKNLRIDLGDFPYAELEKQWIAYFDQQRLHTYIPLETVLLPGAEGRGRDEQGAYVVFQEAVAEYKPKAIERIGMWPFGEGIASTSREARGLQLFNVWIANADMKDEENNKLSLRPGPDGELDVYLTQQDIGHAFGLVLPERVNAYPWEAFESSPWSRAFGWLRGRREINYMNLQQAGLEWIATWADSKWMARRIAQFSREQIAAAVALGRWPAGVGPLYVEKLINRRNQIVRVFGLEAEYGLLPVDRSLTTADGSVVDGELVQGTFPDESPIRYDGHHPDIFGPVFRLFGDGITEVAQVGIGSVDEIDPGTFRLTGEWRIAPQLVLKLSRRVLANPEPQGRFDQHVVADTLRLGFRLGFGNTGFAEGGWAQTLSLAYPVATRREGIHAPSHLLPLMWGRDLDDRALPARHVLARERAWRVGASVRSSEDIEVTAGADLSHARVFADRTVIDRRERIPVVYHDEPRYWDTRAQAFARLGVVDIPFVKLDRRQGRVEGRAWALDPKRLGEATEPGGGGTLLERVWAKDSEPSLAELALGPPLQIEARHRGRQGWLGLFFASSEANQFGERVRESAPGAERSQWQFERQRVSTWRFLDNGERQRRHAMAWQGGPTDREPSSGVRLGWHADDLNTHSHELDAYYRFLAALAPRSAGFVAPGFVASDWEVSGGRYGRWTRMKVTASLHLRPPALRALCRAAPDRFDGALAEQLGVGVIEVERARRRLDRGGPKQRSVARRRLLPEVPDTIRQAHAVERRFRRACARADPQRRLEGQARALFGATRRSGETFDPVIVGALLGAVDLERLAGEGALLLEGRIHKAFEDEHNLPERRDIVGRIGEASARVDPVAYRLFPLDGVEQWKQLDWVRDRLRGADSLLRRSRSLRPRTGERGAQRWTPPGPSGTSSPGP